MDEPPVVESDAAFETLPRPSWTATARRWRTPPAI